MTSGNDIVPKQEMRIAICFDITGKRFANKTPEGTSDSTETGQMAGIRTILAMKNRDDHCGFNIE
jgi:hypothetical protein